MEEEKVPVASVGKARGKGSVLIRLMWCRMDSSISVSACLSGKSSPTIKFKAVHSHQIRSLIISPDLSSH